MKFTHFLGVSLVLHPLYFNIEKLGNPRNIRDITFTFIVLLSLTLFGIDKTQKDIKISVAFLLSVACFGMFHPDNFYSIFQWLMVGIGSMFFIQLSSKDIKLNVLSKYIALSCAIHSIFIISGEFGLSYYNLFGAKIMTNSLYAGILTNRGNSGMYAAITFPFLFSNSKSLSILPLAAVILVHSEGTTTPLLAIACGFIFSAIKLINKTKYKYCNYLLVASLFLVSCYKIEPVNNARLIAWIKALKYDTDFIFGMGLGWVSQIFIKVKIGTQVFAQLHNEYLEAFVALGILGVMPIAYMLLKIVRNMFILDREYTPYIGSTIAILFCSMFWFPFHISSTTIIGIISLSVLSRRRKNESNYINVDSSTS